MMSDETREALPLLQWAARLMRAVCPPCPDEIGEPVRDVAFEMKRAHEITGAIVHEHALIEAAVGDRGRTDCSTPLYIRVQNVVARMERAEAELEARRPDLATFAAGIAAAEIAVANVSAANRSHDFALGLSAAGEIIHVLVEDPEDAFRLASVALEIIDGEEKNS
jgi:hypothetical protein